MWNNYDNLALTMKYYDGLIKSRQELLRFKEIGTDPFLKNNIGRKNKNLLEWFYLNRKENVIIYNCQCN